MDVRCDAAVLAIGRGFEPRTAHERVVDARGGALLPGLHDHHIHLHATAAAARSLDCSDLGAGDADQLQQRLRAAGGSGWLRVVGYHESLAGDLDRWQADALCATRPLRIQHASGKLWILNSRALEVLAPLPWHDGLERRPDGTATGRLWRMDDWLQARLASLSSPPPSASLRDLSRRLASYGVTGVTDASYRNDAPAVSALHAAHRVGDLLQRVDVMGDLTLSEGAYKIMLDEDALPPLDDLAEMLRATHLKGRTLAFHCVSHLELLYALSALQQAGVQRGVRIEHGGVVRPELYDGLRACQATVVTQPGFIAARGSRLLRQADVADRAFLYPYASLLAAGVPVAASSDAPYGPIDPWRIMAAAVQRRTSQGVCIGARECVPASEALRGYLSDPCDPGGPVRRLLPGVAADLCLLDRPLQSALNDLAAVRVVLTVIGGKVVYEAESSTA